MANKCEYFVFVALLSCGTSVVLSKYVESNTSLFCDSSFCWCISSPSNTAVTVKYTQSLRTALGSMFSCETLMPLCSSAKDEDQVLSCDEYGHYKVTQCTREGCYCSHPFEGYPISQVYGNTKPTNCEKFDKSCQKNYLKALQKQSQGYLDVFFPDCDENGNFGVVQCYYWFGCWCADPITGDPVGEFDPDGEMDQCNHFKLNETNSKTRYWLKLIATKISTIWVSG